MAKVKSTVSHNRCHPKTTVMTHAQIMRHNQINYVKKLNHWSH